MECKSKVNLHGLTLALLILHMDTILTWLIKRKLSELNETTQTTSKTADMSSQADNEKSDDIKHLKKYTTN